MTKIHHNTAKKAQAHGIALGVVNTNGFEQCAAVHVNTGRRLAVATDPKDALDLAIAALKDEQPKAPRKARAAKPRRVVEGAGDEGAGDEGDGDAEDAEGLSDEELGLDDEDAEDDSHSVVKPKYRTKYRPHKMTNGDDLAQLIRKQFMTRKDPDTNKLLLDWPKFRAFAAANGCWQANYGRVNHGLARMSVVNRLRAKVRKGHKIVWG